MLSFALALFYKLPAALFSKRRQKEPDLVTIVLRIYSNVGCDNSSFNGLQHIFFPWLNSQCPCIHHTDVAYLVDGCRGTIIIYHDAIHHLWCGLTCTHLN